MTTVVFADLVGSTSMYERLGDGLFVVFRAEGGAVAACINIQKRLQCKPIQPGGSGAPVQMQMQIGIESGTIFRHQIAPQPFRYERRQLLN